MIHPVSQLPWLSLLVAAPLIGVLAALLRQAPPRRTLLAPSLVPLGFVAAVCLAGADRELVEAHAWIPTLGASYTLALDGLGLICVSLVAVMVPLALWSHPRPSIPRSTAVAVFALESCLLGLFLSRDLLGLTSSWGGAAVAMTVILASTGARRSTLYRFAAAQLIGLTLVVAVLVECQYRVSDQTGFPNMELGHWFGLVLFPAEEWWLYGLVLAGLAFTLPLFPPGALGLPRPLDGVAPDYRATARILLASGYGLVSPYFLLRVVLPSFPRAARASADGILVLALAGMVYAVVMMRRGTSQGYGNALVLGFQGLFLLGLFSFRSEGVFGAHLALAHLSLGLAAFSVWESMPRIGWLDIVVLMGLVVGSPGLAGFPALAGILEGQWHRAPWLTLLAALGWLTLSVGLGIRAARRVARREVKGFAIGWRLVPVLALSLWIGLRPSAIEAKLEATTEQVVDALGAGDRRD